MFRSATGVYQGVLGWILISGASVLAAGVQDAFWTTGYYPAYRQSYYPPSAVDFSALTHIIHFSVVPKADGTLDAVTMNLTPAYAADLISHAHAADKQVLICVGGAESQAGFQGATSPGLRAGFISNLVNFVSTYGYDGVDVDWEPLEASDAGQFASFISQLRAALNTLLRRGLLTVATASQPALFASMQAQFDQINLMTYDLAGPWPGWVTWFNSPIFDGGYRFASTGELIPSTDGMVSDFLAAGVSSRKLAIGLCFYGRLWTQATGTSTGGALLPRQSWTTPPLVSALPYFDIMSNYYQSDSRHWDSAAQAAYLSLTNTVASSDGFLSYDDEYACQAKVSYARNRALGGVMIWELGQGYRPTQPAGARDPLLQATKEALATPRFIAVRQVNDDVRLSFTSLPLATYRVLWRSNLLAGGWITLTNNLPGTGKPFEITDPGGVAWGSERFYRVQTPP